MVVVVIKVNFVEYWPRKHYSKCILIYILIINQIKKSSMFRWRCGLDRDVYVLTMSQRYGLQFASNNERDRDSHYQF